MILAAILLVLWTASAVLAIVNRRCIPRLGASVVRSGPLVSVIIPARNEERALEGTLRRLLAQTYADLEVIVVDDESADRTGAIARRLAAADPRLRVVQGEAPPAGWLGKPWAHHQGSRIARGTLLLFVDADVAYEPEAVGAAVAELRSSGAGLLALLPRVAMRGVWEHLLMPQLALAAFAFLPTFLMNRVRVPKLAIGGGTGILIRREVYEAAGGHEALRNAVIDDISLARLGARVAPARVADAGALVSVRMYHGLGEIVRGFTKNFYFVLGARVPVALAIIGGSVIVHLAPWAWGVALAADLVTGRAPAADTLTGTAALAALHATRLLVYVPLGYGLANALFGHLPMVAVWTWIALRSVWQVGVLRRVGWRGRVYDARIKRFGA